MWFFVSKWDLVMTSMGFSYCLFSFLKEDYPLFYSCSIIRIVFRLFSYLYKKKVVEIYFIFKKKKLLLYVMLKVRVQQIKSIFCNLSSWEIWNLKLLVTMSLSQKLMSFKIIILTCQHDSLWRNFSSWLLRCCLNCQENLRCLTASSL